MLYVWCLLFEASQRCVTEITVSSFTCILFLDDTLRTVQSWLSSECCV